MSFSMYSGQVQRLSSDIASLRAKLADSRKKLADADAKSAKAAVALAKARSTSQLSSKARELERFQKAAAAAEKKIADLEKPIAAKQKNLANAQDKLDRSQRDQRKKDEREAEKRRKAEINHIKALERERRAAVQFPRTVARDITMSGPSGAPTEAETFDVCLSFAGEQRSYVELVAQALSGAGLKVFYDQDEEVIPLLWGKDLAEYLDYVYRMGSRYCLMFISREYAEKVWTKHERRSAMARAMADDGEYILPARFDDTELPGLRPTVGYLDLREVAPTQTSRYPHVGSTDRLIQAT